MRRRSRIESAGFRRQPHPGLSRCFVIPSRGVTEKTVSAIDREGNIYIRYVARSIIGAYKPDGTPMGTFEQSGSRIGEFLCLRKGCGWMQTTASTSLIRRMRGCKSSKSAPGQLPHLSSLPNPPSLNWTAHLCSSMVPASLWSLRVDAGQSIDGYLGSRRAPQSRSFGPDRRFAARETVSTGTLPFLTTYSATLPSSRCANPERPVSSHDDHLAVQFDCGIHNRRAW